MNTPQIFPHNCALKFGLCTENRGDMGAKNDKCHDVVKFAGCGGLESQIAYLKLAVLQPIAKKGSGQTLEKRFGVPPPKGILFYGPPGTGKTRLAQALRNELADSLNLGSGKKVHFIYRKGRDVATSWFGQGSQNLRNVFDEAKENAPCIIFFDELDGLCPTRTNPYVGEGSTTIVTTMLGLMDEVPLGEVFIIGATNRLDGIDPAIRRPGRFDKQIEFHLPTDQGRQKILEIHTNSWKVQPTQEIFKYCREKTKGYSGADLGKLCLDAFDSAVSRVIKSHRDANPGIQNLVAVDFSGLNVELLDWEVALGKMRPSNQTSAFGSAVYTPSTVAGQHAYMEMLIRDDLIQVEQKLRSIMEGAYGHSRIQSFYMWSAYEDDPTDFDQLIIDPVLRSESVEQFPVYVISSRTLSSVPVHDWGNHVNSAFDQALNQFSKSILYVQGIDEISSLLQVHNVTMEVNLEYQLERLRGTPVLLLLSGNQHPDRVPPENPFRRTLEKRSDTEKHSVGDPSLQVREEYFQSVVVKCFLESGTGRQWNPADVDKLRDALSEAVKATENKNLSYAVCLHNAIITSTPDASDMDTSKLARDILKSIAEFTKRVA